MIRRSPASGRMRQSTIPAATAEMLTVSVDNGNFIGVPDPIARRILGRAMERPDDKAMKVS